MYSDCFTQGQSYGSVTLKRGRPTIVASPFVPSLHLQHVKTLKIGAGEVLDFPQVSLQLWPQFYNIPTVLSSLTLTVTLGIMRISQLPLSSLPWITFHFQQITKKSLACCCFWPPELTASYIFQMSMQSREYRLQGNPICSTDRMPVPHHESHGWPSGDSAIAPGRPQEAKAQDGTVLCPAPSLCSRKQ